MTKPRSDRDIAEDIAKSLDSPRAEAARDPGADAKALLQRARDAGGGSLRAHFLHRAQGVIAQLNPARHQALIQNLQGQVLALQGRGGDTRIAHVTPGEVVIPKSLQTPELMRALAEAAEAGGMDPASLSIGSSRNSINPRTGHPEFDEGALGGTDDNVAGETSAAGQPGSFGSSNTGQQPGTGCQLVSPNGQYKTSTGVIPLFQPQMASKVSAAIQNLNANGIIPTMTDGYRTQAMQDAARAAKRAGQSSNTVADGISAHQVGLGVDFGPNRNTPHVDAIHSAMIGAGLVHNVKNDPPHYAASNALPNQTDAMANACADAYNSLMSGGNR